MKNMKWKQFMAKYENCFCQNFFKTVLTEGALCEFVEGKWWKKSNDWIFFSNQKQFFNHGNSTHLSQNASIIPSVADLDSRKKLKKGMVSDW